MNGQVVATPEEWLKARLELLEAEKAFARQGDALAARRRALPWVKVEKDYRFRTNDGERSLTDLFGPHRQLIVQHFMLGPGWEAGCPMCSFWADGYDGMAIHMAARDAAFVAVSRGSLDAINAYRRRMGWSFDWVSCEGSDFNFDFNVSFTDEQLASGVATYNYRTDENDMDELPGTSVFAKNAAGEVFHTYSTYGRGLDRLNGAYAYIDLTPKGRDEDELPFPMAWVRRHDEYGG